ncbi:ABC transporter permease [Pseudoroseicyclus tamaricis]|uniref:ABC transporter permease n=1 Tax=Pseudoroseicyclus tamaricis TaxID=2705421 RepID=A0A6B2JMN1_9RHOB|nr:ABC transporter permease [Pseudoroseicyclus tamaricis]NDV02853.1 ABC transporter permease [Pseudoroseicyclus tamaricis]
MFQTGRKRSAIESAFNLVELIYHSTVRNVRKTHRSALGGLFMNILQNVLFIATFYAMFQFFGMRQSFTPAIRGDFLLYIMSGVFLFMVHIKTVSAVTRAEGPTSPLMQHAPLNTTVTITAAALASLYLQVLSIFVILFFYHVLFTPISINDPFGALCMVGLAWFCGVAIGMMLLALKPWAPNFANVAGTIWNRANMVASGKMFVANTLPGYMLALFAWNPLFHIIDQARGFIFLNYTPHFTSWGYPLKVSLALIVIGMMGEFYTRQHASKSWGAGR